MCEVGLSRYGSCPQDPLYKLLIQSRVAAEFQNRQRIAMQKRTNKLAELLKPVIVKAITDTFGIEKDELDRKKKNFLPKQAVLYLLKKYGCSDGSIREVALALPGTIAHACERVEQIIREGGQEAEKIQKIEASVLAETLSSKEFAERLGESEPVQVLPSASGKALPDKPEREGGTDAHDNVRQRVVRAVQEEVLGDILLDPAPEFLLARAKKYLLYFLWSAQGLSPAEISEGYPTVTDDDIYRAIGWVAVTERNDKAVGRELRSIRAALA